MVTIVDPHIKDEKGWYVQEEIAEPSLVEKLINWNFSYGGFVRTRGGNAEFTGHCWPGRSKYPDFVRSEVRKLWASFFMYDKYLGSTPNLYTWNDMNEPSVFSGPEVTMPKDLVYVCNLTI
jgi:alpha 1,3-glucosidase